MKLPIPLGNIRHEDLASLQRVTAAFQQRGFDIELAGSARTRRDYQDLDLVLTPSGDLPIDTYAIESVVETLSAHEGFELLSRKVDREHSYVGRIVEARYRFTLGDATFDACYQPIGTYLGLRLP